MRAYVGWALMVVACVGPVSAAQDAAVAVRAGAIFHGQTIPLPVYDDDAIADPADCTWAIFPRTINTGHDRVYGFTCDADANRVARLLQVTLHGTFYDPSGTYLIVAVRSGGGAEIAITSGEAGHGDTLPLPAFQDGTIADESECVSIVTPRALPTGYNSLLGFECWADPDRVVTMRQYSYAGVTYEGRVNHLTIAVRADPGWQAALRAESRGHGNAVTFPSLPWGGEASASGVLSGIRGLASGHDATLGFVVRVEPDGTQYVRQTTIAGGGSHFFDSLAMTLTLVTGPLPPVPVESTSWGHVKGLYR